jgi:hypothetical protein
VGFWGIESQLLWGFASFLFEIFADPTLKTTDGFGGSTPNLRGKRRIFWGLGVDSPILGSWLAKPLYKIWGVASLWLEQNEKLKIIKLKQCGSIGRH